MYEYAVKLIKSGDAFVCDLNVEEVKKNRPSSSKGVFIKMITLSSTMGPGLKLNES